MNTQIKLSKVQKAIQKIIEDFIDNENENMGRKRNDNMCTSKFLPYCFQNNKNISVDGDLYDILYYGKADYEYGSQLYTDIHNKVDIMGYCLEYEGQGIYNIVKGQ